MSNEEKTDKESFIIICRMFYRAINNNVPLINAKKHDFE